MKILITGGAGFIGTHLSRYLLKLNHDIVILDNLSSQVHPPGSGLAPDLVGHVQFLKGDICDSSFLRQALSTAECMVHLAAETGTGQSMYEVGRYERANIAGTAMIYDLLAKQQTRKLERIVVASSRSIYGEGAYLCVEHGMVYPKSRSATEKQIGQFDPLCPICNHECKTVPTPESAPLQPSSFYGLTKQVQEQMVLMFGKVLNISSFALRYQNVYGPGQSLQNPYTGILAIFSNLARTGQPIQVFEDGLESRDFVYVGDVVAATSAACLTKNEGGHAINVGSGERVTVRDLADTVNAFYGGKSIVETTGAFREGDIRHGIADLTKAKTLLKYSPQVKFQEGLRRFLEWANESEPSTRGYEQSLREMEQRGLLHGKI